MINICVADALDTDTDATGFRLIIKDTYSPVWKNKSKKIGGKVMLGFTIYT